MTLTECEKCGRLIQLPCIYCDEEEAKPIRDLGTMKILSERNAPISYIVIQIGGVTYSTKFTDLAGSDIKVAKEQETETVGIGRQINLWLKGIFTESKHHKKLEEPIPFQINIYTKPKEKKE